MGNRVICALARRPRHILRPGQACAEAPSWSEDKMYICLRCKSDYTTAGCTHLPPRSASKNARCWVLLEHSSYCGDSQVTLKKIRTIQAVRYISGRARDRLADRYTRPGLLGTLRTSSVRLCDAQEHASKMTTLRRYALHPLMNDHTE